MIPPTSIGTVPLAWPSDEEVAAVVRRHLHPDTGSPYWVERDQRLGHRAFDRVDGWESAKALVGLRSPTDQAHYEEATRRRPVEDFVPHSVLDDGRWIWASQTGGTTGPPKHGTWGERYWDSFLRFSAYWFDRHDIPRDVNWLYISPMGPHTIGRMAVDWAHRRGGRCFSIDLDPRIVKIFGEEGDRRAYDRYIQHIFEQVTAILTSQRVGVIYGTARLLEMLPEYVDERLYVSVRGVVHAGTTLSPESHQLLRDIVFPRAAVCGMYGSSVTSVSFQKPFEPEDAYALVYVPSSPYVVIDVVDESNEVVSFGEEGTVRVWRLTDDCLIPGFWERDRARRIKPYGAAANDFPWPWIGDPYSEEFTTGHRVVGVY
jgi:thienamycin biosynthesis protein ThnN